MEPKHPRPTSRTTRPRRRLLLRVSVAGLVLVALTVSVVSLALAVTPSFPDVPASHPYHEAITDLAGRGIINGYADGSFRPDYSVVRQQFAKMIVLTMGHDVPPGIVCPFLDVDLTPNPVDPLYPAKYVAVCALHGITRGTTATTFDPSANITRFQLLSMVVRAVDEVRPGLLLAPPDTFLPTWDPDLSPQHGDNAARAEYNGLLAGMGLSVLDPDADMTRGETAQVLHNVLAKVTPVTTTLTSTTEPPTTSSSTTVVTPPSSTTTTVPHAGWEDLGGVVSSSPAVASWGERRLDVVVRSSDNTLHHKSFGGGSWSAWEVLEYQTAQPGSDPALVSWGPNRIDLFFRTNRIFLQQLVWRDGDWNLYSEDIGGALGDPGVCSRATGSIDLFNEGATDWVYHRIYSVDYRAERPYGWLPGVWDLKGGVKADTSPAAVSWGTDRMDVFAWRDDDHIWHTSWNGDWSAWEDLGGPLSSKPTACSWGPGRLDVFARGPDGLLWHKYFTGVWSGWHSEGGAAIASAPAAVSWGPNRIDVFAKGTDDHLLHRWWNGSTWLP